MKKISTILFVTLIFSCGRLFAQCDFVPRITPHNPTLCPNTTDTLWTQVYDSYQWYRGNKAIAGATDQFYIVSYTRDVGQKFKVTATKNGCTAASKSVLVDGYVFVSPYIILGGDLGYYDATHDARVLQPGDTMILTYSFSENVTWYNRGVPIPGATSQTYYVTHTGSYTVCAGPTECPNYILCLGLPVNAIFKASTEAFSGDELTSPSFDQSQNESVNRLGSNAVPADVKLNYNSQNQMLEVSTNQEIAQCSVTNILGQTLITVKSYGSSALQIPATTLNTGIYLVTLSGSNWQISRSVLIKKE